MKCIALFLLPLPLLAGMSLEVEQWLRDVHVVSCRAADLNAMAPFAVDGDSPESADIQLIDLPEGLVLQVIPIRERRLIRHYFAEPPVIQPWRSAPSSNILELVYVTKTRTCKWFAEHPRGIVLSQPDDGCDTVPARGICALDWELVVYEVPPSFTAVPGF